MQAFKKLRRIWGSHSSGYEELFLTLGIQRCVVHWKSADVSEEHVASIFRFEELAKQETNMKQVGSRALKYWLTFNRL
jgi:hypothetical protein